MDLRFTAEQEAFRDELRAWLGQNIAQDIGAPDTPSGFEQHRAWERALYEAGYQGLAWPVEYGGRGADVTLQAIFEEEYASASAPTRLSVLGEKLLAPTLMVHGTDEQRRRWLPRILTGEDLWSQGFSEPNAGSDLAGIKTRADREGDELVVNGQKIWTSGGALADWIFALVRTDPSDGRHQGITFVGIDMRSPGVEARPLVQLDGHAGFAEVFFTDVRVPVANVVGEIGEGWPVAMTTLGAERDAPARPAGRYMRDIRELADIARARRLASDPVVRDALGGLVARAEAYRLSTVRTLTRLVRGEPIGADASVSKLLWSELERSLYETGIEILGPFAEAGIASDDWRARYWYSRAATIYAGTSEIQRNIVSERVLGLPR